jgi:hypothetical protein
MEIQSRIDGKKIVVNIQHSTNYGILLSGGLDSAVLLYFILKEFKELNIPLCLQPFSIPKFDGSYAYVKGIIDYFNKEFNFNIPQTIIVGDPTVHHSQQNKSGGRAVFTDHPDIDFLFVGLNQNPPETWGDPKWERPNRPIKSDNSKVLLPFIDLYKTHIVDFMFEHEQEFLTEITHTCTEQPKGRCNKCFQCQERIWAFDQLNQIDLGKL